MKTVAARITLFESAEGGRKIPISAQRDFNCPIYFRGMPQLSSHGYDCRLRVRQFGKDIAPGETVEDLELAFLSPDEVIPHLTEGTRFELWESGIIGEGTVTCIPQ